MERAHEPGEPAPGRATRIPSADRSLDRGRRRPGRRPTPRVAAPAPRGPAGGDVAVEPRTHTVQYADAAAVAARATHLGRSVGLELRRSASWLQLARFCVVGSTGYAVNLAVYATLLEGGVDFIAAAVCSFLAAVGNNYTLNRLWTFRARRGNVAAQGGRYLAVSVLALVANVVLLTLLVRAGLGEVVAQGTAVVLVTPLSFLGNKLWSFGR